MKLLLFLSLTGCQGSIDKHCIYLPRDGNSQRIDCEFLKGGGE